MLSRSHLGESRGCRGRNGASTVERHRRELRCPPVMGLGQQKALVTPPAGGRGPSPTCRSYCGVSLWLPDGCGSFWFYFHFLMFLVQRTRDLNFICHMSHCLGSATNSDIFGVPYGPAEPICGLIRPVDYGSEPLVQPLFSIKKPWYLLSS